MGYPPLTLCVVVTWSLMISSSPWAKALGLLPGTGMNPGSALPLLMSKAKNESVWALLGAPLGALPAAAADSTLATPVATSAAAGTTPSSAHSAGLFLLFMLTS